MVYGIYDVNIDNVLVSVKTAPRIALCAASWLGEKLASKAINVEVIIEIKKEKLRVTFTPNGKREVVPRELAFSLIVVYWLLLLPKNK